MTNQTDFISQETSIPGSLGMKKLFPYQTPPNIAIDRVYLLTPAHSTVKMPLDLRRIKLAAANVSSMNKP